MTDMGRIASTLRDVCDDNEWQLERLEMSQDDLTDATNEEARRELATLTANLVAAFEAIRQFANRLA